MNIICGICKREFKNPKAFTTHLARGHKTTPVEQYHLQFINPETPKCPVCGKDRIFNTRLFDGYQESCGSKDCRYSLVKSRSLETCISKYGVENPMQVEAIKDNKKRRYLEKTGYETPLHNPAVHQKSRDRLMAEEGIVNVGQRESVKTQIKASLKEHYGLDVTCPAQVPEVLQKQLDTTMDRYGVKSFLSKPEVREIGFQKQESRYGVRHFLQSSVFSARRTEYLQKQYATNIIRYGGITPTSDPRVIDKQHETKRRNGTFNTSKPEEAVYALLSEKWEVVRQYKDLRYPFCCDFYLPRFDTFVEFHGMWTHGPEAFNPNSQEHLDLLTAWRAKPGKFFKLAISNWTISDPRKRRIAKENGLNFVELWGMNEVLRFMGDDLQVEPSDEDLSAELKNINRHTPRYEDSSNWNRIVLKHQLHFYEQEKQLWKNNPAIRSQLLTNRVEYLKKAAKLINDKELLRGFTISGLYRGFSHHSPMWIKKFIKDYKIASVYDPFGGWGQRLLGSGEITYIYNDTDLRSCSGVLEIIKKYNLKNKTVYNNDAYAFTPVEDYEAVFTCPPYHNVEVYQGNPIKESYEEWVNVSWRQAVRCAVKPTVRLFAFVMAVRFTKDLQAVCLEEGLTLVQEVQVGQHHGSHLNNGKRSGEILSIFGIL